MSRFHLVSAIRECTTAESALATSSWRNSCCSASDCANEAVQKASRTAKKPNPLRLGGLSHRPILDSSLQITESGYWFEKFGGQPGQVMHFQRKKKVSAKGNMQILRDLPHSTWNHGLTCKFCYSLLNFRFLTRPLDALNPATLPLSSRMNATFPR